ncbi:MAG: bifunctional diaminohydroxyphosphoribosylaminopyrimidine deaminase/5-amino-6-(5-phosphoribosylamino)uracil reductase RibD [Flavobacteriaceae bacterium]|nr:bifunctional diaminohydroxyphosphoribosylaminopyrimidine deaminase/5-amino-6-(5-phosphoribosylamino)uracil reductase RibD [Flavobacteriaceae bacterium]
MQPPEFFMQRCLQLASLGQGNVAPNPLVGCVIVHNGNSIGEGYHQAFGQAHAEVNAMNSVADHSLLSESTLYVNLEPCNHHGKTPPCVGLLLEKGIKKVVIAQQDPNPLVAGQGITLLKNAGVDVKVGILEKEAKELNKQFNVFHEKKRPYVTLKWAETADGFIAPIASDIDYFKKKNISGPLTNRWVHKLRAGHQAILVGATTARLDNPQLNVRHSIGQNPLRIVLDPQLRLPHNLHLFDGSSHTLLIHDLNLKAQQSMHPNIDYAELSYNENFTSQLLDLLFIKNIQSLLVEGGKMVLETFLSTGSCEEIIRIISSKKLINGVEAPRMNTSIYSRLSILDEEVLIYKIP